MAPLSNRRLAAASSLASLIASTAVTRSPQCRITTSTSLEIKHVSSSERALILRFVVSIGPDPTKTKELFRMALDDKKPLAHVVAESLASDIDSTRSDRPKCGW